MLRNARNSLTKTCITSALILSCDHAANAHNTAKMDAASETGWIASPSLGGIVAIPTSDFSLQSGKSPGDLPHSAKPDVVGAFRFICGPAQILADDPIVYPGQPGRSHLHQFYGNTSTNALSTYAILRKTGKSTCSGPDEALNRSAYWMPALLDGRGNVIRPNYLTVYYKRFPKSSPQCTNRVFSRGCVAIPNGLRMIAGRNMAKLSAPSGGFHFSCTKASGETAGKGAYRTMSEALAVCTAGWELTLSLDFPSCWDGVHIDSPDHRSHLGYARYVFGGQACPANKPYFIPSFKMSASYSVIEGDDVRLWRLSSDSMIPNDPPGSSLHGDYFEGWDPATKQEWTDNCIDKLLSCQGGNLGDGFILKGAQVPPWGWGTAPERLVPIASLQHSM